ncbi:hypothetical protein L484_017904 [Morus notabilis]|uniref:Uncharacterized protein n=1 Tax=Morus notabilis TaxID=981085 RepID=W9RXX6_9ROSA|nr:hypothetical protein L484_017904 [Morus notabilis]
MTDSRRRLAGTGSPGVGTDTANKDMGWLTAAGSGTTSFLREFELDSLFENADLAHCQSIDLVTLFD